MATGAQLLVDALQREGVRHIFGVSGSPTMPVLDVVYQSADLTYIQAQHEEFAMLMANGYARMTRQPGVCLVSPGPGITHALTGIAQAFYAHTPAILIGAEDSTQQYGYGPSLHHGLEPSVLLRPITKSAVRVERADRVPEAIRNAFRLANSGRRGPVFVGLPTDIQRQEAEVTWRELEGSRGWSPPMGDPNDVERAAALLADARCPVALIGQGVHWAQAHGELREVAERLGMPVANTPVAKGLIPMDHPLALGTLGHAGTPVSAEIFRQADAVLVVGTTLGQFSTGNFGYSIIPRQARIVQIDLEPAEVGRIYPVAVGLVADAGNALKQLSQALADRHVDRRPLESNERVRDLLGLKAAWEAETWSLRSSRKLPIQRWRLLHDLRQGLPREALVAGQSGGTSQWFEHGFEALTHAAFEGGWHVMGAEFCEALGAKLAAPEKVIVCLTGDGSLMMSIQEFATAAEYGIAVVCVVCHNGCFGNERHTQTLQYQGRYIGTRVPDVDLAQVARGFGAYAERVELPEQIIPALSRALEARRPALLDVIVDSSMENLVPPKSLRGGAKGAGS